MQHETNLGFPGIASPFDMPMATPYNFETTATTISVVDTPTALAIPNLSPSSQKAPTLVISPITAVEIIPLPSKVPMLAISRVEVPFSYKAIPVESLEAETTNTVAHEQSFQHTDYCRDSKPEDPSHDGVMFSLYVPTTPIPEEIEVREAPGSNISDPIVIDDETEIQVKKGTNEMFETATRRTQAQSSEQTVFGTSSFRKRTAAEEPEIHSGIHAHRWENYDTNDARFPPSKRRRS